MMSEFDPKYDPRWKPVISSSLRMLLLMLSVFGIFWFGAGVMVRMAAMRKT